MLICSVAELERMTSKSVATCLTLSVTTSRGIQCDRSARYKGKGVLQTLVIDLIYWWCELIEMLIRSWSLIRSWRSEQNIKKVQHVSHACNNSHVLIYPMLCNCICILTGLYDKIHKNHKETEHMQSNIWSVNSCQGHNHFVSLWMIELH